MEAGNNFAFFRKLKIGNGQFVALHGRNFLVALKLLYQIKQVFADLCEGFSRFRGFDSGKAFETVFGKISIVLRNDVSIISYGTKLLGRSAKCGVEMLADLIDRN